MLYKCQISAIKIMNFLISAFIHCRNNNRTTLLIYCFGPYVFDVNERISSSLNYPDNSHLQRRQNFMKKADSSFTCVIKRRKQYLLSVFSVYI